MFNCMKKVKVETETPGSGSDETDPSSIVVPLTLENLHWDQEARHLDDDDDDDDGYVKKFVVNKSDPTRFRPRPVLLSKYSVWIMQKYLSDVERHRLYDLGEVEGTTNSEWSDNRYRKRMNWLYSVFRHAWIPRLKVFKPFVLDYDKLFQDIKPISSGLKDIARFLKTAKTDNTAIQEEPLKLVDVTSDDENIDDNRGVKVSLRFKLLYQAHVDLVHLHGQYDNCYIRLMKLGDEEEKEAVIDKIRNRERDRLHTKKREKKKKSKKSLNYWEKLQKSKMKQKQKEEHLIKPLPGCGNQNHGDKTASEKTSTLDNLDIPGVINDQVIQNATETTDSSDVDMTESMSDLCERQQKKKKRGVLRRLTAPLRWMKKKF